ncbi:ribonuclease H [Leucobacter sp. cx-169]|uniref:ribonuclease H family protein n=1 Tax=Leucobacter sp. cx-169 TaxID=2770549 RepID=UPI00165DB59E|nr:ribonuclease H [Leucobacter sp. cx-169]MBC9927259.1 ribonuclease HI [Leucobacter sp. cx-169]
MLTIATDGSTRGNPGPTGWAWAAEDGNWESGSLASGTNNIGELLGVIRAIEAHMDVPHIRIESDSQYVVDAATKWGKNWRRNGWVNGAGKRVANKGLVAQLVELVDAHPNVEVVWVRGHAGHILNGWADNCATAASAQGKLGIISTFGSAHGGELLDVTIPAPTADEDRISDKKRAKRANKDAFANLTALGHALGLTAVKAGWALTDAGLRDPETREPTAAARGAGLCKEVKGAEYVQYLWHTEKTAAKLQKA